MSDEPFFASFVSNDTCSCQNAEVFYRYLRIAQFIGYIIFPNIIFFHIAYLGIQYMDPLFLMRP